jgi:ABC-type glycerol-3-phosphate transport system permease component
MPQRLPPTMIIVPMFVLSTGRNLLDTRSAFVITYLTLTLLLAV